MKAHKVKVSYVVELTPEQRKACLKYADSLGLSYDKPKPQTLLKRLFKDVGQDALLKALEAAF
ncbi:MAG TPA: hypothetical protein VEH04_16985 [Verrucomicrobiae bacterium]|nr:hypothetical protein [Verrucomicrobiae bacterium]